ncbi:hypothetical protein OEG92_07930 [Polaribacter sejongensis]|uniref:hypothetical protein n=1 Tax=Polaribacter sejongensis TaxID=985043 RepID=UPI0035A64D28
MSLTRQEVITQIARAEELYKANLYVPMQPIMANIQENIEILGESYPADTARYYRIYMLYIGVFEELNMPVLESYLQALININEILPSDYECVCSYYKHCEEWVYEKALMTYPYNETLHIHYALKLQEEQRFEEAISTLKYILECYPALTEARFLLWEVKTARIEQLRISNEAADAYELLNLASDTHRKEILTPLQFDDNLDQADQNLARIQLTLWSNKSIDNKKQWISEWRHLELTDTTRFLLADYAKSFMMYDMVSQILAAPKEPRISRRKLYQF